MTHPHARSVRRSRAALAAAVGALGALLLTVMLTRLALTVADTLAGEGLAGLLTTVSTAACALVAGRLTLCLLATAVATVLRPAGPGRRRGGRVALALSPRAVRPVVALLLTAGLAAGSATNAAAAATPACSRSGTPGREPAWWAVAPSASSPIAGVPAGYTDAAVSAAASAAGSSASGPAGAPAASGDRALRDGGLPDPLWPALPEPAWTPPPPPPTPLLAPADATLVTSGAPGTDAAAARAALTADDQVVVRRGDSLWRIAERHLGADATDAQVAVEWPRWWHANRRVVGLDPDLLLPGTRLTPPDP